MCALACGFIEARHCEESNKLLVVTDWKNNNKIEGNSAVNFVPIENDDLNALIVQ